MIPINEKLIGKITSEARKSERKRQIFTFHNEDEDTLQRMINVMETGTYVQPHKHSNPEKREVFIILKGKALAVVFSNLGDISDIMDLDPTIGNYGVEIPPNEWHTIVPIKESVFYELKDGPYNSASDKDFAPWAPAENTKGVDQYIKDLNKRIKDYQLVSKK